ncbi:hypothetical protein KVV02_003122 [Mortierella alpina]|uniref:ABC transmembrane type-1 domain-containing protein n=1 Tax=Mortierella alpina TaxID=64518 RepID=A0A9P8CTV7_MORAP|nr:hypothetical protein KVV02_003122 [Mortierella alpina]
MPFCDVEEWGPVSKSRPLDFTTCFQDSVLTLAPSVLLLLGTTPRLFKLLRKGRLEGVRPSLAFFIKAALATVALSVQIALLVVFLQRDAPSSALLSTVLSIVAMLAALLLHYFEYVCMPSPSSMLLVFWLFTALLSIFPTRTQIELSPNGLADALPLLKLLFTVVTTTVFGLENIPKPNRPSLTRPHVDKAIQPNPSPEPYANLFSRFTFIWVLPLLNKGKKKTLRMDDIWSLHPSMLSYPLLLSTQARIDADEAVARQKTHELDESKSAGAVTGESINKVTAYKIRLFSVLAYTIGWAYVSAVIPCLLFTIATYIRPILLSNLIAFMASYTQANNDKGVEPQPAWEGYGLMLGVLTTSVLSGLFLAQYENICFQCSIRARGMFNSLIYRKALRLSSTSKQEGMGSIVNHMSSDVDNVLELFVIIHTLWSSIIGVIIALVLLHKQVGYAMFASLGVTFGAAVVGGLISSMTGKAYSQMATKNDQRMKLVSELVDHIKSIKLYAWERYFVRHLSEARIKQLNALRRFNIIISIQVALFNVTVPLSSFAMLTVYSYIAPPSAPLDLQRIFTCIILLNMLGGPLSNITNSISSIVSGHVSYVRLRNFFESEEINPANVERFSDAESPIAYEVKNGTFGWYSPEAITELETKREKEAKEAKKIKTVDAEPVPTDENKKALNDKAESIGSEMSSVETSRDTLGPVLHNVSFIIQRGSLTAVIGRVGEGKSSLVGALLGEMYKYTGSVRACGSLAFVAQSAWILNDTVRNNILFGHEYDKERYLQVIRACALAPDLKMLVHGDKTLIGEKVDQIIVVKQGRISQDGTYNSLIKDNQGDLHRMIAESKIVVSKESDTESAVDLEPDFEGVEGMIEDDKDTRPVVSEKRPTMQQRKSTKAEEDIDLEEHNVVDDEVKSEGRVEWAVYKYYFRSMGYPVFFFFALVCITYLGTISGTQVWLQIWGNENYKAVPSHDNHYWILTYLAWVLAAAFALIMAIITFLLLLARRASKFLHISMISPLVNSPMSFFDTTSSGKIINRFAHDFSTIDLRLPFSLLTIFLNIMVVIMQIAFCIAATPYFLILMVPLFGCYYYLAAYYLVSSREIKRLDSAARSPMYAHFSETLNGLVTIRGYGDADRFSTQATQLLDRSQQVFYLTNTTQRWLQVMLQLLSDIVTTFIALMAVVQRNSASAGVFAIVLNEITGFTLNVQAVMSSVCDIETTIVSVERVKEYSELMPEAPYEIPDSKTDKNWPQHGRIEFQNYSTRYREDLDLVLKNVDLSIRAGERVGIVGRTGDHKQQHRAFV